MTTLTPHQKAALNFKNHISLTANAGSGKTFVLSKRYLDIALTENVPLRNIAAITFTDKAASELYKKIAKEIDENLNETNNQELIRKLESIRRQLVSANISTIHSFCMNILRDHPVEAELDANFIPVDEQLSGEFIELSVEEVIKDAINNELKAENLKYLIRIFASKGMLAKELILLVKNRKNVIDIANTLYIKTEKEIAKYFRDSYLQLIDKIFIEDKNRILKILNDINQSILDDKPENTIAIEVNSLISKLFVESDTSGIINLLFQIKNLAFTQKSTLKERGYFNKNFHELYRDERKILEDYFSLLNYLEIPENPELVELELAKFGKAIIELFNATLKIYDGKKRENGFLDYEDILLHTQRILLNENVKEDLGEKFKYVMIDEYQDTNELQYNIFLPILDNLKKNNLFVVGDEKQSIYMFRDAELKVFEKTKKDIEQSSGGEYILSLPDSFRMAPALCLFTNTLFQNIFSKPSSLFNEVTHSDLVCARDDDFKGHIEILIPWQEELNLSGKEAVKEQKTDNDEAELVAKRILKLNNAIENAGENHWGDIAILCRKRKSFCEIEKAFLKYNIPFAIIGGKGFYQRQAIYDIYNYFSFLLDENNDTALVGILRSPFFNLSDTDILKISLQDGYGFWNKFQKLAKEKDELTKVVDVLIENIRMSKSLDVAAVLRKILNESDFISVVASRPDGVQELANIEKLIKLTIGFNQQGFKSMYDYVNFLKDSIEQTGDESQATVAEESNAVRIMTLHQAKGLEFPIVFLYKCEDTSQKNIIKSKSIQVDKTYGILTKVPVNGNYFTEYESAPIVGVNNLISTKKNSAEIKRLLYVGLTRAKNYLFISAGFKKDSKYSSDSFMGMILDGLDIDLPVENFALKSNLKYLIKKGGIYSTVQNPLKINIPVISYIEEDPVKEKVQKSNSNIKNLRFYEIRDKAKGEIISATKVAVYNQCPLKYRLTYDYGFGKLMNKNKKWYSKNSNRSFQNDRFEFNEIEDYNENYDHDSSEEAYIIHNYADVKGRIIHKILQHELSLEQIPSFADEAIKNEINPLEYNEEIKISIREDIVSDLKIFFNSEIYSYLKSHNLFMNEYEIYVKESDYYLYGIIDKLIIDDNKLLIIDYKTDDIDVKKINDRAETYLTQLKFYSYIVSRLFKSISTIELKLIFIKHPDNVVSEFVNMKEIVNFSDKIKEMISMIREQTFTKNLSHCKKCSFVFNHNKCIKV